MRPSTRPAGDAEEGEETGIGLRPEKHATPMLRVFGSNLGSQWLMYGSILGGRQDHQPSSAEGEKARCDWLVFYYQGVIFRDDQETFGDWRVTVRGKGLEPVAHWIGRHVMATLRPGVAEHTQQRIAVESITIEPFRPVGQDGQARDDD